MHFYFCLLNAKTNWDQKILIYKMKEAWATNTLLEKNFPGTFAKITAMLDNIIVTER